MPKVGILRSHTFFSSSMIPVFSAGSPGPFESIIPSGLSAIISTKKHTHANATELDKIAAGDKAKWDAAEQNAKDYADSLASDYDAAGSAAEALADAKEYTDTALTWGSF